MNKSIGAFVLALSLGAATVASAGNEDVVREALNGTRIGWAVVKDAGHGEDIVQVMNSSDMTTRTTAIGNNIAVKFFKPGTCVNLIVLTSNNMHTYRACHDGTVRATGDHERN